MSKNNNNNNKQQQQQHVPINFNSVSKRLHLMSDNPPIFPPFALVSLIVLRNFPSLFCFMWYASVLNGTLYNLAKNFLDTCLGAASGPQGTKNFAFFDLPCKEAYVNPALYNSPQTFVPRCLCGVILDINESTSLAGTPHSINAAGVTCEQKEHVIPWAKRSCFVLTGQFIQS